VKLPLGRDSQIRRVLPLTRGKIRGEGTINWRAAILRDLAASGAAGSSEPNSPSLLV